MNENLKWFLFDMTAFLRVRDGSTFTLTNMGVDLFRFGKYVRGTISGISGTVLWDSSGRLVHPNTYQDGSKNLVLKMTLAQMETNNCVPPMIEDFLEMTGGAYNTYSGSLALVTEYQLGPAKQLLRMSGTVVGTPVTWDGSGEPLDQTIDYKLGFFSEISNYPSYDIYIPNWSQTMSTQYGGGLNTVLAGSVISLSYFFTDLTRNVIAYIGNIGGTAAVWDGQGNHTTPTDNMVDIVSLIDFDTNY